MNYFVDFLVSLSGPYSLLPHLEAHGLGGSSALLKPRISIVYTKRIHLESMVLSRLPSHCELRRWVAIGSLTIAIVVVMMAVAMIRTSAANYVLGFDTPYRCL